MNKAYFSYLLLRVIIFPLRFCSYRMIHLMGRAFGLLAYHLLTEYRKRTLSNLSLASDLHLSSNELKQMAKRSFQNLAINCLEYPKFFYEKDFTKIIHCENPEEAIQLHKKGVGIIFFCGHQANWETLFLDGAERMRGIAIAKSTKNPYLYQWILSIREKTGGKIIDQKKALLEGSKALKQGTFLGILADQGSPESGFIYPFLGRDAYTSLAPALLSYKTNSPIITATVKREKGRYLIHYSPAIYPDRSQSLKEAAPKQMKRALKILEDSIKESPADFLWQHNRYKQQTPKLVYKEFRKDSMLIVLPEYDEKLYQELEIFRRIYPTNFLYLLAPKGAEKKLPFKADEVFFYERDEDLFLEDFRFKLLFDFRNDPKLKHFYLKRSVSYYIDKKRLTKEANKRGFYKNPTLKILIENALCRPGIL